MSALWAASEARAPSGKAESYAAELYERHYAAVFRHCLKQLRRREDADDAVQTTFVYALLSLRRGVVPRTELAWLYTIASNVCSTNRRASLRRGPLAAAQDVDALHDVIPTPDRNVPVNADDFRTALSSMPSSQRNALLLREWQGLSYNEIAEKLGLTQSATETLLFRARRTLAQKLEDKAGVGTVNGFSIAALIRSFLQSGAGKTMAVALSATAIAVTPAAEHRVRHASTPAAPLTQPLAGDRAAAASTRPSVKTDRSPTARAVKAAPDVAAESAVGAAGLAEPKATTPTPQPTTPTGAPPESAEQSTTTPVDAIVTTTADTLPDVGLPPVAPLEDALPPLPEVQLPGVSIPAPALPPPIG
jgi:RNA polymerase sigma factor (sigma-70 family)